MVSRTGWKRILSTLMITLIVIAGALPAAAKDTVTITYMSNAGQNAGDGNTVIDYGIATDADYVIRNAESANVIRPGYVLRNWNSQADGNGTTYEIGQTYQIKEDIRLYAIWDKLPDNQRTLYYDFTLGEQQGTGSSFAGEILTAGDTFTILSDSQLNIISPAGYKFIGWYAQNDGPKDENDAGYPIGTSIQISANMVLYAYWEADIEGSYGVIYYDYDKDMQKYQRYKLQTKIKAGTNIQILSAPEADWAAGETPEKSKYTFKEWNTKEDGSGKGYKPGDSVTINEDTAFYAQWENNGGPGPVTTYTVSYYDGNQLKDTQKDIVSGTTITLKGAISKPGYTFTGWNTQNDGKGISYKAGQEEEITADLDLYAQWTTASTGKFVIAYYDGNVRIDTDTEIEAGSSRTLKEALTKTGYTFTGWNTALAGTGTSYRAGQTVTVTADMTLYAQWRSNGGGNEGGGNEGGGDGGGVTIEEPEVPLGGLELEEHWVYIFGYPDSTVKADNAITRAEAASIFFRLLSDSAHPQKSAAVENYFGDIAGTEWHAQAVNYMAKIGILEGYEDNTFRPDRPITRAEFATIASRFDKLVATEEDIFSDVPADFWAVDYINSAYQKGWVSGYPDGTFKPLQSISRAEVVTLVNKMLDRAIDAAALAEVQNPYTDIATSHWAYADVIEASVEHDYERDEDGEEVWSIGKEVEKQETEE